MSAGRTWLRLMLAALVGGSGLSLCCVQAQAAPTADCSAVAHACCADPPQPTQPPTNPPRECPQHFGSCGLCPAARAFIQPFNVRTETRQLLPAVLPATAPVYAWSFPRRPQPIPVASVESPGLRTLVALRCQLTC